MHREFINMLKAFREGERANLLLDGRWGLEKESQRVTPVGDLALTDHPSTLGDKTGNPMITTDFSESQLEMITPPMPSVEAARAFLEDLQKKVELALEQELLWPLSMPPRLPDDDDIPLAEFSQTPEGRNNEVYRRGLALRYGKKMQMISGIHYNFSFGEGMIDYLHQHYGQGRERREFVDDLYFSVARNYLRYRWLLIYLFGASPAFDPSYLSEMTRELEWVAECCPECCGVLESPLRYATSLRVSRFGYSNRVQRRYRVSFNSLNEYIRDIRSMVSAQNPEFARLGLYKDGRQIQLNANVLQKDSEFYSAIRFKQNLRSGETQLDALEQRGVGYLEVRILDLNPLDRLGISLQQLHFLQAFMLFCLFEPSPVLSNEEFERANNHHHQVALYGRKPGLQLKPDEQAPLPLSQWGMEILQRLESIATLMDRATGGNEYRSVIDWAVETLRDSSQTLSAVMQREMAERHESHIDFGLRIAIRNHYMSDGELEEDKRNEPSEREIRVRAFYPIVDQGGDPAGDCRGGFGWGR